MPTGKGSWKTGKGKAAKGEELETIGQIRRFGKLPRRMHGAGKGCECGYEKQGTLKYEIKLLEE